MDWPVGEWQIVPAPRTTNERRAHYSNEATKEILVSRGVAFKLRQERNSNRLPNAHDDLSLRY